MCVYVDNDGNGIPQDIQDAAEEMFADYVIDWIDLQQRPPCKIVSELPSSKKQKGKELSDLSRTIDKNLHVFDNLLNVKAVCASYKITNFKQEDIPCVTVFVLEKGRVPAGETNIKKMKELNGYPFDVVEGYYRPAIEPSPDYIKPSPETYYAFPVRGGVGIGVRGVCGVGTLGGFLEDDQGVCYILSCEHVLNPPEVKNNPNEKENPNNSSILGGLSEDEEGTSSNCSNQRMLQDVEMNNKIIEHPAELDYCKKLDGAKEGVKSNEDRKFRMEKLCKEKEEMGECDYPPFKTLNNNYEQNLVVAKEHLKKIENSKPREIGRYFGGWKGNFAVTVSVDDNSYGCSVYVDAAIAKLDNQHELLIKTDKLTESETSYCPVYGFKKTDDFCPSGDLDNFLNEFYEHDSGRRFAKIGRTSGYTDKGFIDPAFQNIFVKTPAKRLSSASSSVSFRYCKNCMMSFEPGNCETDKDSKSSTNCAACDEKIGEIKVASVNDDVEDATTENDDVENVTTENKDVENVTTENDDVKNVTTENKDVENVTTENNDVENVTTENNDVENVTTENVDDNVKDNAKYKPVWVMWARNCFLIRKKYTLFGLKGDSGALVFDQKNNYAWGLVFGILDFPSIDSQFCLASPLCVTLKALEDKTGIKGLKLW